MVDSDVCVAVASAMPEEIGALADRVAVEQRASWNGHEATVGTLGAAGVVLMHTGTGPERARTGVAALLDRWPIDLLMYVGVAGALDPALAVEALLVPTSVRNEDGRAAPPPADPWVERAATIGGAHSGTLVTVNRVVTQPEEKAALRSALSLDGPAAIDMETFAVAHAAADRAVPYLSLRIISDAADESLPDLLKDAQREDGSIDRTQVMQNAVWSPSAVPTLMRMRRRVQNAAGKLAEVVPTVLRRAEGT